MLCRDRDFVKRVVALYIFAWLVFATLPLSLSLTHAKGFLKSTPFTGTRQKYVNQKKRIFIHFSSSHSLTWQKCLTWLIADNHSAARKIPWGENQLRDVGYFQSSPWVVSLAPLPARSLGKSGRASLSRWRPSHEHRTPRAEAGLFPADPCLLLLLSALLLLVTSALLLRAS